MARILIVGVNYAPEKISTGKYTAEMCEWLAEEGHDVRVICSPPYYPEWRVSAGFSAWRYKRESLNGVRVIRCPIWVPKNPHGIARILHLLSFGFSSALAILFNFGWRPKLVIAIAPTLISAPAAWVLSRAIRARSWLHVQDFEVEAMLKMGIVRAGGYSGLTEKFEKWVMGRFDVVSTISEKMVQRLAAKCVPAARQCLLPNWVDTESIYPLRRPSSYRTELQIPSGAVVALYSGNMGLKQGLETLSKAAIALSDDPDLFFVFAGDGPARKSLEDACRGLRNVRFAGLQSASQLNEWLGLADIHLLPQRADVADLVMPSKLTGMMASGRAILGTAAADTAVAVALTDCGLVADPSNTGEFIEKLRKLARDPQLRIALGQAAREKAVATVSRSMVLSAFSKSVLELLEAADPSIAGTKGATAKEGQSRKEPSHSEALR